MIKGLAITPPIIGRIAIGRLVQKQDKWVPEKDDSFTLTTQIQQKSGWLLHPLHQHYCQGQEHAKLRAIPVRVLFNDTELNLRADYSAFDRQTGRPLCVGNGESARRMTAQGVEDVACPGPERCPFGSQQGCKLYGRLNLYVEGQEDELGSFMFRTTGYNSVRTLAARLKYFEAASGGLTRYLPLTLRLRAKSTTQSYRTPVFYVDLTLRDNQSLAEAISTARQLALQDEQAGVDVMAMEQAARQCLLNGQFEDMDEEVPMLLEEFSPPAEEETSQIPVIQPSRRLQPRATPLTGKLGKGATAPTA